jgi:hypothetical protein
VEPRPTEWPQESQGDGIEPPPELLGELIRIVFLHVIPTKWPICASKGCGEEQGTSTHEDPADLPKTGIRVNKMLDDVSQEN